MYLSQAISHAPSLGIEWDLFQQGRLVEEYVAEPAEVACSVGVPLHPAAPLQSRQVRRDKTGQDRSFPAKDRLQPPPLTIGA